MASDNDLSSSLSLLARRFSYGLFAHLLIRLAEAIIASSNVG